MGWPCRAVFLFQSSRDRAGAEVECRVQATPGPVRLLDLALGAGSVEADIVFVSVRPHDNQEPLDQKQPKRNPDGVLEVGMARPGSTCHGVGGRWEVGRCRVRSEVRPGLANIKTQLGSRVERAHQSSQPGNRERPRVAAPGGIQLVSDRGRSQRDGG